MDNTNPTWYQRNKAKKLAANKIWRDQNADKMREHYRVWRSNTRAGRIRTFLDRAAVRSRQGDFPFALTKAHVAELLDEAVLSGAVTLEANRPTTASIDRLRPELGYVDGNVQIIPQWLNFAYHDFDKTEIDALIALRAKELGQ